MSNYFVQTKWIDVGALTDAGTLVYAPGAPEDILDIVLVTTVAYTVANDTVTLAVRNVDDTSSVTKGSFVVPFVGSALNKVLYIPMRNIILSSVGVDGSTVFSGAEGAIKVNPGQELLITDGGQQTVGASRCYIKVAVQDFSGTRVSGAQQLTFTAV